jgi:hypothetical protein
MYKLLWQQRRRFCSYGKLKQFRYASSHCLYILPKIASTCAFMFSRSHLSKNSRSWCWSSILDIKDEVHDAIINNRAVVALESTIITHGMPHPQNLETALEVENIVRAQVWSVIEKNLITEMSDRIEFYLNFHLSTSRM